MSARRPRFIRPLVALLWIAAVAALVVPRLGDTNGPPLEEAPPLPETTCRGAMIGVHSTLAFERDAERREDAVTAIDDILHAQIVRDSLLWHEIEPVEGERDWSRLDSVVAELRQAGIEPLLTVLGSPPWANGVDEATPDHFLYVPEEEEALDAWLEDYSEFLAEAVERYREFVRRWEIWNEPNLPHFWRPRPDPSAYSRVYETLRETILRVDPTAEVAVGGLATLTVGGGSNIAGLTFLRRLTNQDLTLDIVGAHPYTTNDHPPNVHIPGEKNFDDLRRLHDLLAARGERASIWATEWGWSSATVGESAQAEYVDRSLAMIARRYPFVRVATYFTDHDRPPRFFQGLLHADLEPKPAAERFRGHAERAASHCDAEGP